MDTNEAVDDRYRRRGYTDNGAPGGRARRLPPGLLRRVRPRSRRPQHRGRQPQQGCRNGASPAGSHRRLGQQVLPRRDDVRRLGQPRPRRVDPRSSTRRWTPGSTSSTPPTSTGRASRRRSSARRSPAAAATTSSWPRSSTARWARTPTSRATRAAGSSARSRTRCGGWAPTGSTSTRSTASTRGHRHRGDAVGAQRPRAPGQGPLHRLLHLPGQPDRRGAVGRARPATCSASSPSSRPTRSSCAPIEADVLPTCLRHGMGVMSYSPLTGGWLSGRWRKDTGQQSSSRAEPAARALRPLPARQPAQARRRRGARAARRRAGITLIQLAIAFVLNHPAITAALIGPRTMEQLESQLAAADVVLDEADPRPDRRDRRARDHHQPGRQLLRQPGARAGRAATLATGGGVLDDAVDDLRPGAARQVVAHAVDHLEPRVRDRACGRAPAGRADEQVGRAVDDERRRLDPAELPGSAASRLDRREPATRSPPALAPRSKDVSASRRRSA